MFAAEKVKESQSRHNSLGQESPELRDLARLRGRRSNSLVTELLYRDPRHPATSSGSDPDLALSSDTEETHVTRMRLLRIESYGDILGITFLSILTTLSDDVRPQETEVGLPGPGTVKLVTNSRHKSSSFKHFCFRG